MATWDCLLRRRPPCKLAFLRMMAMVDAADGISGGNLALKGLGYFQGKVHILPISVYYEDTDLSGMVYHANYLRYMERGRTEFFRLAGISRARLEDEEPTAW